MIEELKNKLMEQCYDMKIKALEMATGTGANGSHIGGAFSSMELFAVLYEIANVQNTIAEERDRIIVSKGHCVLSYYTVLWKKGLITEEELATFDKNGTLFHGHPHRNLEKGIEFSAGSLGLGISYAVGVALACKNKGLNNRIFVILGDGECDEGIVWESLMSIANYKLDNITVIVDRNKYQLDGPTDEIMKLYSMEEKFNAFGFHVQTIDGHDINSVYNAVKKEITQPNVVIADTIKANGISFLMNNKNSHHTPLIGKKYNQAVEEIKKAYGKL